MANLYNDAANNYATSAAQEPDEISLFLQQILLRSSSSSASSSSFVHQSFGAHCDRIVGENREPVVVSGQISAPEMSGGLNSSSACSFAARTVGNLSSSSVGNLDAEADEYDYESEEAVETFVEEAAAKPTPPRSSSKRSRAAEVHNLSEKRRRSRINEKMKALQNLIPNSNKTDKASMLDEAIEYLKQLQLQVQMLTMRNGLSLYPICLPGMVQQNQNPMDISERDKSLSLNMAKPISNDQNVSNVILNCVKPSSVVDFSTMNESKASSELDSSLHNHFGAFQFSMSKDTVPPPRQHGPETSSAGKGFCVTSSAPFEAQECGLKENALEACLARGDRLLPTFADNPIFSSQLNM